MKRIVLLTLSLSLLPCQAGLALVMPGDGALEDLRAGRRSRLERRHRSSGQHRLRTRHRQQTAAASQTSGTLTVVTGTGTTSTDVLTHDVQEGRMIGLHGSNPFPDADVQLSGGEIVSTTSGDTPDVIGTGASNVAITLGSAGKSLALGITSDPDADLTVVTTDGYTLDVASSLSGSGRLVVNDPGTRARRRFVRNEPIGQVGLMGFTGGTGGAHADQRIFNFRSAGIAADVDGPMINITATDSY